jgi:hypothetical protein
MYALLMCSAALAEQEMCVLVLIMTLNLPSVFWFA